jgi:TusA-related sulfurtransferase
LSEEEAELSSDAFYDAGEGGCSGPALREIGAILDSLAPGQTLEIRTTSDVGRGELEAWTRLRGHVIEQAGTGTRGDRYLIRRR